MKYLETESTDLILKIYEINVLLKLINFITMFKNYVRYVKSVKKSFKLYSKF